MKYFDMYTRLLFDLSFFIDWVLNYLLFLLGYMKCQTGHTMKYQEIQRNTSQKT
jgi:hypothetical protein